MTDRAQLTTPRIYHKIIAAVIGLLILMLIHAEGGIETVANLVMIALLVTIGAKEILHPPQRAEEE